MRSRDALVVRRWQLEHMLNDMLERIDQAYWCQTHEVDYELDMMHCRLVDIQDELTELEELLK